MDPVSLILTALTAGAAAVGTGVTSGVKDATKDAVVDLYGRLKAALVARFGDDIVASKSLERYTGNPDGYESPLRDSLMETGAAEDVTIVDLARQLLAAADPDGAQVGRYNVKVTGSQGVVIGDNAHVTQTFY
jgi:hypothetical protein